MSRKEDTAPNLATGQLADLILTEQEAAVQVILRTDEERRRLADNRRAIEKKERELSVERERQFLAISTGAARRDTLGRRIGFNWWREYVMNHYTGAELHWLRLRDSGEAINTGTVAGASPETAYCQLSDQEFRQLRPRPTLKETLLELAGQRDFYVNS